MEVNNNLPYEEMAAAQGNVFQLLGGVPITPSNQLYFESRAIRDEYFDGKVIHGNFTFKFIREYRALKVAYNVETIENANYMRFRNVDHNGAWMYCYIDRVEYINPHTSTVYFHLDPWQTYFDYVRIKDCDIVREHVPITAGRSYNTVPEGLDTGDLWCYQRSVVDLGEELSEESYIIISAIDLVANPGTLEAPIITSSGGGVFGGLPSACTVYYVGPDTSTLLEIMTALQDYPWVAQGILTVFPFPRPLIPIAYQSISPLGFTIGRVGHKNMLEEDVIKRHVNWTANLPPVRNPKLYTYPYTYIEITMQNGATAILKPELLEGDTIDFSIFGTILPSATIGVHTDNYEGVEVNVSSTQTLYNTNVFSGFPELPVQNNQYIQAKAQANATNELIRTRNSAELVSGVLNSVIGSAAMLYVSKGSLLPFAIANVGQSLTTPVINEAGTSAIDRQKIDQMNTGPTLAGSSAVGSGALSMNYNYGHFEFLVSVYSLRPEYLKRLDDYFDAFGYKANRIGIPTLNNRPRYNYIQCNWANIYGDIPIEHLNEIRKMFASGVMFWHDYANVGTFGNNQ